MKGSEESIENGEKNINNSLKKARKPVFLKIIFRDKSLFSRALCNNLECYIHYNSELKYFYR